MNKMEIYDVKQVYDFFKDTAIAIVAILTIAIASLFAFNTASAAPAPAQAKVDIVYFWGDGCPHCEHLKPWLDQFEKDHKDKVNIYRYEFWKNPDNAKFFMQTMEVYGVPLDRAGSPAAIINGKALIGVKDIQEQLEKETNEAYEKANSKNADDAGLLTGEIDLGEKGQTGSSEIAAITATALADSVNPCAMMVLIILLSSLIVMQKSKTKVILTAVSFILATYITYFLIGLGLTQAIMVSGATKWVVTAVGGIAIVVGLLELKDAFFYRKGGWAIEIPDAWREKLAKLVLSVSSPAGAFITGMAVTFFELPCTGGPYLFGLSLISQTSSELTKLVLLGYYNVIFVLPLVVIAIAVICGKASIENAEAFRNKHVKAMHFIVGVIMLIMGAWALFLR